MKIVLISNLYPPNQRGGAESFVRRQAIALKSAGHQVTVISTHPEKNSNSRFEEDGIEVIRFRPKNIFYLLEDCNKSFFSRLVFRIVDTFNFFSAGVIFRILKKQKSDLVITHNLAGLGLLTPSVIRFLGLRHIHMLHDTQLIEASGLTNHKHFIFYRCLNFLYRFITWILFSCVKEVVAPSRFIIKKHFDFGFFTCTDRSVVASHIMDSDLLDANSSRKKNVNKNFREGVVYLFIGQLEEHKGVYELLRSFREFTTVKARLIIVGCGSLVVDVKKFATIDSRIEYVGYKNQREVFAILSGVHYLIVPSLCEENSPSVIAEALCCGVPVIASNVGGVSEMISAANGFLYDPNVKGSLIEALHLSSMIDCEMYKSLRFGAIKYSERFSARKHVKNLLGEVD